MTDVNPPHAASGIATSVENEAQELAATREFYRFLTDQADCVNQLQSANQAMLIEIRTLQDRLTAAGIA